MRNIHLLVLAALCGACSSSRTITIGGGEMCAEPPESAGSWSPMALPPSGIGAAILAFAWTGNELILWGGSGLHTQNGGCVPCNGGGAYDPKTNSWRALNSVGAPTPRDLTAGVWTGKYFVTWGGLPSFTKVTTFADQIGGVYDLAQDSWQAVSTIGQPEWRFQHDLAWSGREMLVWGGTARDNRGLCNGGKFDPVENIWRPMNLVGAPGGCVRPATAWTGSELLVFGGELALVEDVTNTGAAYDPETDTWRPMSTVGAPSPRAGAATVWTGEEMIVYGGNVGVDARAYNPTTDHWRTLNLHGAPDLHTRGDAVWTGTEMILWGRGDCDVGGRYDLASDTWQPFSSKGVLAPRSKQTLVWTGEAMIVYGGSIGTHFLQDTNSGAMYTP